MSEHRSLDVNKEELRIHHWYMSIINSVPDAVYWVDPSCNLLGCNKHFATLLGLNKTQDFKGTPYQQMKESALWVDARIDALKLDDMNAIFSGKACYDVTEEPIIDKNGATLNFKSSRVPMFNEDKELVGLTVVLTQIQFTAVTRKPKKMQSKTSPTNNEFNTDYLPNVLMIEDNIIAQNVERALLTTLNCRVDIAETGDKALELFNPGKYDLVLMDIGLENTSGYVVAKQLRQMEKNTTHHVPIIALTGYEADVVKFDCSQYFMEGAISKPLTSEQAEQILKHYVFHIDTPVHGLKSA